MYVEGKVLSTDGTPVPGAIIETWETDGHGAYPELTLPSLSRAVRMSDLTITSSCRVL